MAAARGPGAPIEVSDVMHYETRAIRDALRSSSSRAQSARSGRLRDLQPQQSSAMLQDWRGLAAVGDLQEVGRLAEEQRCVVRRSGLWGQARGHLSGSSSSSSSSGQYIASSSCKPRHTCNLWNDKHGKVRMHSPHERAWARRHADAWCMHGAWRIRPLPPQAPTATPCRIPARAGPPQQQRSSVPAHAFCAAGL